VTFTEAGVFVLILFAGVVSLVALITAVIVLLAFLRNAVPIAECLKPVPVEEAPNVAT
jgi:hypothetical protein